MKERPILFSGPMVRAILDGRKTQTRRVVVPQPEWVSPGGFEMRWKGNIVRCADVCPYGVPGDRLWVREAFGVHGGIGVAGSQTVEYRADWTKDDSGERTGWWNGDRFLQDGFRWRNSIHMPRWASRIMLEVVAVRVERLQRIGGLEAVEEGCRCPSLCDLARNPVAEFSALWDSINAKRGYGWDANPWVRVVQFRVWDNNNRGMG